MRPAGRLTLFGLGLALATAAWLPALSLEEFDRRILDELKSRNPPAAALFEQANAARAAGRHREAADLYERVHRMAPEFSHALRREGGEELALDNRPKAIELCREALALEDSPENETALASALVRTDRAFPPADSEKAEAVRLVTGAAQARPDDPFVQMAVCETAIATNDLAALETGARRLAVLAPEEPATHYMLSIAAASEGRFGDAESELARARERGLPDDVYRHMLAALRQSRPWTYLLAHYGAIVGGIWVAGMALLFVVGLGLSGLALRAAARPATGGDGRAAGLGAAVWRAYAGVLWLCCAYYYLSIPLLLAAVVLATGGIIYVFLYFGHIPIGLVISLLGVTVVSLASIVRSLFIRRSAEEPGTRLRFEDHPEFVALLRDVAEKVGTQPIETVYLTPGTDCAVTERGGILRQLAGRSERCLILGLAVLDGMRRGAFRAVMAHEYGHLSNRDTAGGRFALAVRRSLTTMAGGLARGGAARWYNPAWIFVQGFYRVFLRISQGATRLQEVMADRWAAVLYGGAAFEAGLRHVIARQIRFSAHADASVKEVVQSKQPLDNIYVFEPAQPPDEPSIASAIEAAIAAKPSPYDSHPAPLQRFASVHDITADRLVPQPDAGLDVWSLFRDRERLQREMTSRIRDIVLARYNVAIASGRTGPPAGATGR